MSDERSFGGAQDAQTAVDAAMATVNRLIAESKEPSGVVCIVVYNNHFSVAGNYTGVDWDAVGRRINQPLTDALRDAIPDPIAKPRTRPSRAQRRGN